MHKIMEQKKTPGQLRAEEEMKKIQLVEQLQKAKKKSLMFNEDSGPWDRTCDVCGERGWTYKTVIELGDYCPRHPWVASPHFVT